MSVRPYAGPAGASALTPSRARPTSRIAFDGDSASGDQVESFSSAPVIVHHQNAPIDQQQRYSAGPTDGATVDPLEASSSSGSGSTNDGAFLPTGDEPLGWAIQHINIFEPPCTNTEPLSYQWRVALYSTRLYGLLLTAGLIVMMVYLLCVT